MTLGTWVRKQLHSETRFSLNEYHREFDGAE